MSLAFMVVGLPRSGTTWAANWLTTGATHCVHDPMRLAQLSDWDAELPVEGKLNGASCTCAWAWAEQLNAHPARKLVLHRDPGEILASLGRLDLPAPPADAAARLAGVAGLHVRWDELFEPRRAAAIWAHLVGDGFDVERHAVLREMNVQPAFDRVTVNPQAARALVLGLHSIMARG